MEVNGARWPSRSSKSVASRVEREGWVRLPGTSAIRLASAASVVEWRPERAQRVEGRRAVRCLVLARGRPTCGQEKVVSSTREGGLPFEPEAIREQLLPFAGHEAEVGAGAPP